MLGNQVEMLVGIRRELAGLHEFRRQTESKGTSPEDSMEFRRFRLVGPGETQRQTLVEDLHTIRGRISRTTQGLLKKIEELLITRQLILLERKFRPVSRQRDSVLHHEVDEKEKRKFHLHELLSELRLLPAGESHSIQDPIQCRASDVGVQRGTGLRLAPPEHDFLKNRVTELGDLGISHRCFPWCRRPASCPSDRRGPWTR